MSYKEFIYKEALNVVLEIYQSSRYNKEIDLYRIVDIINSVNENQFRSKEWLVKESLSFIIDKEHIFIAGSWYGLLGTMLKENGFKGKITLVDSDEFTKNIAKRFNPSIDVTATNKDAVDYFIQRKKKKKWDVIINTSCEHMSKEDIQLMNNLKSKDAIVVLQSNNYEEINSHVNTSKSLDEFVDYLKLNDILFKDVLKTEKYERYMVIGK